jgi:uncharacterized protein YcaQ
VTKDDLRRYAVARSLFPPTTLKRAVHRLGFVQADPIRAPARAQDLTLRHRVRNYRAGDLERRYAGLGVQEDFFVNYGFVAEEIQALMHPRGGPTPWPRSRARHVEALLDFVRARGAVHPREVDTHFSHGTVTNYWGGSSNATTHLLDGMHYRGLLRVARRDRGIRIYAAHDHVPGPLDRASRLRQLDALVDVAVRTYAPLPGATLSWLINRLRYGVPQWRRELKPAQARARERLAHARIEGVDWFWPTNERVTEYKPDDVVRLLAPFDPIVWDRRRFEHIWGWAYRFEAYVPERDRRRGYYAMPLLWMDRVSGWVNCARTGDRLQIRAGFIAGKPKERDFQRAFEREVARMERFLSLV